MHVTNEQRKIASETDLVDYLISKGFEIEQYGTSYKIKVRQKHAGDMSSVSIFSNRKGWKRWSTGESGGDAISFLQQNMEMSFQEAVLELTSQDSYLYIQDTAKPANPKISKPKYKKAFELPQKSGDTSLLFNYLNEIRKIDSCIINQLVKDNKIYQDIHNNVVFVGYNEQNKPAFACVRGTSTNKPFRGDCEGSDKKYAFSIDGTNKTKLFIFEAPIDLLSHATMTNKLVQRAKAWTVHCRLCLSGTSDVALDHYLKSHPDIKELHFCLDNDLSGRTASEKHCKKYSELGYIVFNHCPKNKDVNEDLLASVPLQFTPTQKTSMKR